VSARPGLLVHRRSLPARDRATRLGVPLTSPGRTLLDLAAAQAPPRVVAAVNEADKLDLIASHALREALDGFAGLRGARQLRALLDRATFVLTDSALERLFLPLARAAGLPLPQTQVALNGFRVDFYWPELGLVVETDGLRYHRTPLQQGRDHVRDQAHFAAGLTPLRFSHAQVRWERAYVQDILRQTARRLGG